MTPKAKAETEAKVKAKVQAEVARREIEIKAEVARREAEIKAEVAQREVEAIRREAEAEAAIEAIARETVTGSDEDGIALAMTDEVEAAMGALTGETGLVAKRAAQVLGVFKIALVRADQFLQRG